MKRRVIRQGHGTFTITLPKKWCEQQGIQPGDEIEVEIEEDCLRVSSEPKKKGSKIHIDITGLDRCSILYSIRNAYRMGYDVIELTFENSSTVYYRTLESVSVLSVVHYEVNNLIGVEVIHQTSNSCTIKDISSPSSEEFETILRRIFILMTQTAEDLVSGIENFDLDLVRTTEEKHDTITKFVSYCLRLINKRRDIPYKQHALVYHIIANIDKIVDIFKYTARNFLYYNKPMGKHSIELMKQMVHSLKLYYEFFYKFDSNKVVEIDKNRDDVLRKIKQGYNLLTKEEMLIITNFEQTLELLADLVVSRMGLE
ncbi:hypothetical protein DRJ48_02250 [Candidatus Woesearchaeota archaeon]|nr:hypothetical protein [Candidatus Woesearchaeota archaeon]RLE42965.1 MAG: hypothetical protein DRJ48_02250 [Candidatus Woesearchaeota archaeon]